LAWREKRLWPFAVLTALIQTGGIYDAIFIRLRPFFEGGRVAAHTGSQFTTALWNLFSHATWIYRLGFLESLVFSVVLALVILGLAILAQGILVLGINGHSHLKKPTIKSCFQSAGLAFVPLVLLNIFIFACLWLLRFLALVLPAPHALWAVLFSFLVFLVLVIAIAFFTSLHLLSLYALLADQLSFRESLIHALRLLRHAWVIVIETAFVLLVIGLFICLASISIALLVNLPLLLLMRAAILLQMPLLFQLTNAVSGTLVLLILVMGGAFAITFQYATWHGLYQRINDGTALPKLHRISHWIARRFSRSA
jgi:hypothetical protein